MLFGNGICSLSKFVSNINKKLKIIKGDYPLTIKNNLVYAF